MKRLLQCGAFAILTFLLSATIAAAQSPYASLSFARETNDEGTTDYVLKPEIEEIVKRLGGVDKPYRIVGALARPSKRLAVLMVVNSQKDFQLDPQSDKSVVVTADGVEIKGLKYELASKKESAPLNIEIGNVLISLDDLRRIGKAAAVTVKLGVVVHGLDDDNLTAMRYLVAEIEKDEKKK